MKIIVFSIAILLPSMLQASSLLESVENRTFQYASQNNVVMVIFEAKSDINSAMVNMKTAMRTRDPNGFINPYWIVKFLDEKASTDTKCGVIIGQWYASGFPYRASWENIMNRAIYENARFGAYLYTQDGEFRITENQQSQAESLKRNCLEGSIMAHKELNTLKHRKVRDPGAEFGMAVMGMLLFGHMLDGDSSEYSEGYESSTAIDCDSQRAQSMHGEVIGYDPRCF